MAERRLFVAALFPLLAACGSSPSSPSAPQAAACRLTNGKVQVVITYARDRTRISSPTLPAFPPGLVLVDFGDRASSSTLAPQLTGIDDYTWTITVFVVPNSDPMSHAASVVDLAVETSIASGPQA